MCIRLLRRLAVAAALATAAGCVSTSMAPTPVPNNLLVYFGTYTSGQSQGIYVSRFSPATGMLDAPVLAASTENPSFLALHPNGRFLYAVNETHDAAGKSGGSVTSFAIDAKTGLLTKLNTQPSGGADPAHLVVDRTGQNVLVANYTSGTVEVLPIAADGSLKAPSAVIQHTGSSVNPRRQSSAHAHAVTVDATNRFVYVDDLGLDKVMIYRFDAATGKLTPNDPPFATAPAGAGPRHMVFDASGTHAYLINEMGCTITSFTCNTTTGALTAGDTISALPPGVDPQPSWGAAEIALLPSGRVLYASTRGHDSITHFAVDASSGSLSYVENQPSGGKTPRGFGIDPSGTYLIAANQDSNSVTVFRIDPDTGHLTSTGQTLQVGAPVCVVFLAAHR
ncbi:MAG TPA: lactonase family protein [Vicinamibacterales bacterium]|jgi:6-phosphogluconolactonase|nr:lactonase family protein [Vicinamibacterales bacterium]